MVVAAATVVTAVAAMLVIDAGLIPPNVKPVVANVVAIAVEGAVGAAVEAVVTPTKGLIMKGAAVVDDAVLAATEVGAIGRANPVPTTGATLEAGVVNREGAVAGAAWVVAGGGAGVDEGLIPREKPAGWVVDVGVGAGAAVVGTGWLPKENVAGAADPNENPPPPVAVVEAGAGAFVCTLPKLKPPKPVDADVAAGAAGAAAGWAGAWAPKEKPPPGGAAAAL